MSPIRLLAIDQGTTSTRSLVFDVGGRLIASAQRELPQHYPQLGWVEHDPEDIWRDVLATAREAVENAGGPIAAMGVANQRETLVVWRRATGKPIYPAIVWQDRRTAEDCDRLRAEGAEELVRSRTGLLLDPYFSASKLAWILDNVAGARADADRGDLAFGTIDSFLLWRLTGGKVHATDATNASRTLLFDIHRQCWDKDLLELFGIPAPLLPCIEDTSFYFGVTAPGLFNLSIPIASLAGDQHAAMVGQACLSPGMAKATYGTGCFALLNTGAQSAPPAAGTLGTLAYRISGTPTYAAEGAIFAAGAAVKWLRDGLGLITNAAQTHDMATRLPGNHGVYMVPAFVGLGAPYWDAHARGLICGLTLDATAAHIARAALEAVAYQTLDLMQAMAPDGSSGRAALRVDGGMAANDWLCQFLADILEAPVERPLVLESTAQGAAYLAGLTIGAYSDLAAIAKVWTLGRRFEPRMTAASRAQLLEGWREAVRRTLTNAGAHPREICGSISNSSGKLTGA
ncbi:glycerol kinase GlpK [Methylocella silvestris]|uniref:Glycerol kinase n=1 Tax=Methylocella silvestris TaxID=199596 RepID=A0A2J7TD26_METSI|nr:glycerol kinase GlpK [Methylocella silvestris]PNG24671.1 glycerol kinase [Methylocella silvestris]